MGPANKSKLIMKKVLTKEEMSLLKFTRSSVYLKSLRPSQQDNEGFQEEHENNEEVAQEYGCSTQRLPEQAKATVSNPRSKKERFNELSCKES